jgi:hypothetical protein
MIASRVTIRVGSDAARNPAQPRTKHHRQIDDVGPGQEVAERKGLAEAGQRHPGKGQEQRDEAGRRGMS